MNPVNLKSCFEKMLTIVMPVLPHITSECFEKLNSTQNIQWPSIEKKYLINDTFDFVLQVNGKKRGVTTIKRNLEEDEIIKKIKDSKIIDKYFKKGQLIKTIYVKNKLVNFIIK